VYKPKTIFENGDDNMTKRKQTEGYIGLNIMAMGFYMFKAADIDENAPRSSIHNQESDRFVLTGA